MNVPVFHFGCGIYLVDENPWVFDAGTLTFGSDRTCFYCNKEFPIELMKKKRKIEQVLRRLDILHENRI